MKILHYSTKNEDGKYIIKKFYPTEEEAENIANMLYSHNRPAKIDFRGNLLNTANIEIFNEEELAAKTDEGYNLNNPAHKSIIWQFENEILAWVENNPDKTSDDYFIEKRAIVDKRTILNPQLYRELTDKWYTFNILRSQREFMKRKETEGLDKLAGEKQELVNSLSFPEDEIDVSKIIF